MRCRPSNVSTSGQPTNVDGEHADASGKHEV
ncbi:hypothetical protein SAMN05421810_102293 [Amycolatopsis arida]|uniref:Uncharacterized protein n=1 Tax=Amycolatopsis arida TaxID=587909 RepID=A0A1I5PHB0_9PSEU|nr:hypothetical protein CLV69_101293 [Amycolatopsis arida]SFP33423.1 hypothetical protein SAMN05421810_102293 [Amycolatopsis arida]